MGWRAAVACAAIILGGAATGPASAQLRELSLRLLDQAELRLPIVVPRDGRMEGRRLAILSDDWFYCYPPTGDVIMAPRGYVTDFASIPRWARVFFNPFGDHGEAAVAHDWLYAVGEPGKRLYADTVFKYAMMEQGVPLIRRQPMYRAVRMGGAAAYGRDSEWEGRFLDPDTLEPVDPPFARPATAAITTMDCAKFDDEAQRLHEEFGTDRE